MKIKGYILNGNEPFRGTVQTLLMEDDTVAYSGGLTLTEYEAQHGKAVVVSEAELKEMIEEYVSSIVTQPELITKERFWNALECMPPSRWHARCGVEMFHIVERITHDLVSWYGRVDDRYYCFNDRSSADSDYLAGKFLEAAK